jgi:hypothetical protein
MGEERMRTNELSRTVARIQAGVMALVFGLIGGLGMFLMTVWLLIKGGHNVGRHLNLLGHYFIGYSVSWTGSVIGLFYGALVGGLIGWAIGKIYNRIVDIRFPSSGN